MNEATGALGVLPADLPGDELVPAPVDDYEAYCLWQGIAPERHRFVRRATGGQFETVIEHLGSTFVPGPWGVER